MKYLASYYWQQERPSFTSLVLQQLVYRRRKVHVLFTCLCTAEKEGGNSYFGRQLDAWFQNVGRELLVANRGNEEKMKEQLAIIIRQIDEEIAVNKRCNRSVPKSNISVAGILCVADYYLLFYRGSMKVYLLNYRFGKTNCRQLAEPDKESDKEDLQMISGRMEQGIGLLLGTKDFGKGLAENEIGECLSVKKLKDAGIGKRHLQELGQASVQNGGQHVGAVLLVTE